MNKVFFAKWQFTTDLDNDKFTTRDVVYPKYYANIEQDDYVFIKPNNKGGDNRMDYGLSTLWKVTSIVENKNNKTLTFEIVYRFTPLSLYHFISLKLFRLTKNLLIFTPRPNPKGFLELQLVDNKNLDIIKNKENFENYIKNNDNYRKILIINSANKSNNEDIQIYLDNNQFKLYPAEFIDKTDIIDCFTPKNYGNGKYANGDKGNLYNSLKDFLDNKIDKALAKEDVAIFSFYDLFVSNNRPLKNYKDFEKYCENNNISYNSYNNKLIEIENKLSTGNINEDVYICEEYDKDNCANIRKRIQNELDKTYEKYLDEYIKFREQGAITTQNVNNTISDNTISNSTNNDLQHYQSKNTILYGVPGCGKSFKVKQLLEQEKNQKRILFYPDYSYSDFVGQIRPVVNGSNITYDFVAGPFTEILKDALIHKNENYYLVIEEINRGNAPAIFGDMFQLLDRNNEGNSEYSINNIDVYSFIKKYNNNNFEIKIPSNLTIIATMNTCDQNVFTLDTAFKRRWNMERISNNNSKDDISLVWTNKNISWNVFRTELNKAIKELPDNTNAEDKLLGAYFLKGTDKDDLKIWASKIFMYLWHDVVKYDRTQLFDAKYKTLDDLLDEFEEGTNVFNQSQEKLYELFQPVITPSPQTP